MTKRRFKTLMVIHCFLPESVGGTEFYTYHLAQNLMRRGFDVTILTALPDRTRRRYEVSESIFEGLRTIKVVNPPYHGGTFIDHFLDRNVEELFGRILKQEIPDLVHFQHVAYLSGNLPEIASRMGIPSVFTIHDYWYMCFRSHLLRPGYGLCPGPSDGLFCASCHDVDITKFPLANRIVQLPGIQSLKERLSPTLKQKLNSFLYAQSASHDSDLSRLPNPHIKTILENQFRINFFRRQFSFPKMVLSPSAHLKKRYEDVGFREIHHLPLGFYRTEKVVPLPFKGILKLAYLGNLAIFKGAKIILRDLLRIRDRGRFELHFHGRPNDPLYFEDLQKMAQDFPEGTVSFHGGYRSDQELSEILSKVQLVIFPSLWEENYPLIVREALLHGVPVIGSRLGGIPEAVQDGVNGYLFDPYQEGDLAEKVSAILENPDVLKKLIEGANNTPIEDMNSHLEKIMNIYGQVSGKVGFYRH